MLPATYMVLVGNHTTIAETLSSLALEYEVKAVAGDTVMKRDDVMVYTAVSLLLDIHVAYTTVLVMSLLQAIEVETGILANISLDNLSSEEVLVIGCMVAEEDPGAGYLSPFGCLPRTHRRFAKRNRKVFQKSFEKHKMRPSARRRRTQRKCKKYSDDLTVHTHG